MIAAMDKQALVEQLASKIRQSAAIAERAGVDAAQTARDGATPAEKREDARVALEHQSLAKGHTVRAERARGELAMLEAFRPARLSLGARIAVGAIVEIDDGQEGRTLFLAPVGAGIELTGPGGDGFLSVVTPASPVGRAVLGRKRGDTIEIDVRGEPHEWTITDVM
jgi:transcription elongation GreA/GreB family factor